MSQENVETFKRVAEVGAHFDAEAIISDMDPAVEWYPALPSLLGGEGAVYRGHEGVREVMRDLGESFAESHMEFPDIRDLGDEVVALGRIRTVGNESGAVTESPLAYVVKFKNGKVTHVRAYLAHEAALEAAGLSE
jgi:ketosteroid isomerase-like protein